MSKPCEKTCGRCNTTITGRRKYCSDCSTSCEKHDVMKKGCNPCRNAYAAWKRGPRSPGKGCADHIYYRGGCGSCKRVRKYGVTPEKLSELEGLTRCEICDKEGDLYLDHNHATGEVRGMICRECNSALGMAGDSIDNLQNMINYLKERGSYAGL